MYREIYVIVTYNTYQLSNFGFIIAAMITA
jgi:hypothetical protein